MTIEEYQQIIEANYITNLELFKLYLPKLYEKLINEKNEQYQLELNSNGLNISKNGKLLYPYDDAMEYFNNFLEAYYKRDKKNILPYSINYEEEDTSLETHGIPMISFKHYTKIAKLYEKTFKQKPKIAKINPHHEQRYSILVFGIGLGYHLPELIKKYEITHLVLIDEDIEMLRASLYTLNWKEIFEYVTENDKYRTMEIMIEDNSEQIEKNLFYMLNKNLPMCYYNLAQIITYQNSFFEKIITRYTKLVDLYTGSSQGFFDDEKWSLQHTIHSLNEKIPVYTNNNIFVENDKHIFVIGNGPSLDLYIDFIKENQEKVIIISAGSSIGALYKAGIRVDIILQIERTIETYPLLIDAAPKEYLKNIMFVGMNTIHPRVFDLFERKMMFLKYSDAGTEFIDHPKFPDLAFTNPTATNGAFRMALEFGFKNISFFGLDFGFKSLENHHSKYSSYYDEKSNVNYNMDNKNFFKVKGNTDTYVYTERVYDNSRKAIEKLAEFAFKEYKYDLKIYNYSEGAFIEHTLNAKKEDKYLESLSPLTQEERENVLKTIENQFVIVDKRFTKENLEDINSKLNEFKAYLTFFKQDYINAYIFLKFSGLIYDKFKSLFLEYKYIHRMINGTFLSLMSKMYVYVNAQKQDKKATKFLNKSIDILIEYFDDVQKEINSIDKIIDRPY